MPTLLSVIIYPRSIGCVRQAQYHKMAGVTSNSRRSDRVIANPKQ